MALIEISPDQVTTPIKSVFGHRDPAGLRCLAILQGIKAGQIFVDNLRNPKGVIVYENMFGTIYPGGEIGTESLKEMIDHFRTEKMVLLGLWPDDLRWELIPKDFDYEGRVFDFYDRIKDDRLQKFISQLPEEYELCPVDAELIERSVNRDMHI